jgi:hypothetical protein
MRVFVIIVGVIMALLGASCITGGVALGVAVGTDGWISSDSGQISTNSHALVSEVANIADEDPDAAEFLDEIEIRLRIEAEAAPGDEVFIGVGPAGEVSAYLADVEHEVVDDIEFDDDLELDTTLVPGGREPSPPGDETFWAERVSGGGEQVLDWELEAGSYRFVMMNADGSPGLSVDAKFSLKIPYVGPIMIGLLVAGGITLLIGVVMIVLAVRSMGRSGAPPAGAPPPATTDDAPQASAPPPDAPPAGSDTPSQPASGGTT